jgi:hypothetical protein
MSPKSVKRFWDNDMRKNKKIESTLHESVLTRRALVKPAFTMTLSNFFIFVVYCS